MGEHEQLDFDAAAQVAWDAFELDLAEHLIELDPGDAVVVDVLTAGAEDEVGPYVQVAVDDGVARLEATSNDYLTGSHKLVAAQEADLRALGFEHAGGPASLFDDPAPANWAIEVDTEGDDGSANLWHLAGTAVRALREVFGVPHPSFLSSDQLPIGDDVPAPVAEAPARESSLPLVAVPQTRTELRALVDEVLAEILGHEPEHDADDDVPITREGTLAWVRVHTAAPVVEVFGVVVDDLTDTSAAEFEVCALNRGAGFVRYELEHDRVLAHVVIPGQPFVPAHLRQLLDRLFDAIQTTGPDLEHRICADVDDEDDERVEHALRVIAELEQANPGSVRPELAAAVCEQDDRLILAVLTEARHALHGVTEQETLPFDELRPGDGPSPDTLRQTLTVLQQALRLTAEAKLPKRRSSPSRPGPTGPTPAWLDDRSTEVPPH